VGRIHGRFLHVWVMYSAGAGQFCKGKMIEVISISPSPCSTFGHSYSKGVKGSTPESSSRSYMQSRVPCCIMKLRYHVYAVGNVVIPLARRRLSPAIFLRHDRSHFSLQ